MFWIFLSPSICWPIGLFLRTVGFLALVRVVPAATRSAGLLATLCPPFFSCGLFGLPS